jgi:hypothetical protein
MLAVCVMCSLMSRGCRFGAPCAIRHHPGPTLNATLAFVPLRQLSSISLAAAKLRTAASSVAPIAPAIGAPCVLALLAFPRQSHGNSRRRGTNE